MRLNKLLRILSVFLVVVIISVGFMEPVAYANAVVAGGLVLLVIALLISFGVVFTSTTQAENTANYVIDTMPPNLLQELAGAVSNGGDPQNQKPNYPLLINGFAAGVCLTVATYNAIKQWFNDTFGVNEDVVAVSERVFSSSDLKLFALEDYSPDKVVNGVEYYYLPYGVYFYDCIHGQSIYNCKAQYSSGRSAIINYLWPITDPVKRTMLQTWPSVPSGYENRISVKVYPNYVYGYSAGGKDVGAPYDVVFSIVDYNTKTQSFSGEYASYLFTTKEALGISPRFSAEAYNNVIPEDMEEITLAIAADISDMLEKDFRAILDDYSLQNWDYRESLDALMGIVGGICADLDRLKGYDALLNQSQALQLELDRLNGLVASQGADVIGGVDALSGAMVDAGLVITGIRDLIDAQNRDTTKIADLERELSTAKEKIQDLTNAQDIPVNPPITDTKEGINWSPLINALDFTGIFPFCIPFDIIDMISSLQTTPKAPVFEIPFEMYGVIKEEIIIDFSIADEIMPFVRTFILLCFAVGLAKFTSSVIKW